MPSQRTARLLARHCVRALACCMLGSGATLCLAQADPHLAEGVRLLRDGHPAEARQQLDLAIRAAPRSADTLTWRGICENQLEQYRAAADDFGAAIRLDPTMLSAHYNFALTLIRLHRRDEAIVQLRIVLAAQPDAVQALYNLAVLLEAKGAFAEAADSLRKARSAAPNDEGIALHLLVDDLRLHEGGELPSLVQDLSNSATAAATQRDAGLALLEGGRFADAVTLFTMAAEREPSSPGVNLLVARALIGNHQDAAAITLLSGPAAANDQPADRAYLLALAHLDQGATSEATQEFEEARKLNPKDARPIYQLALLAAATPGGRQQAITLLRSSVAFDPANGGYALALARLLLVEDKAEEARDVLLAMKDPGQEQAEQHALLGVAYAALHEMAQAVPQLEQAVANDPTLALAHNVLGFCLLQQGEYARAAAAYGRASELEPRRPLYAHDAALAFERANRTEEATRFAERAIQLDDASAGDHVLLGKLYAGAGRQADALQQLLRAAALDPDSDAACYLLARTYQQQGNREEALAWSSKLSTLKQKHDAAFSLEKKAAAQTIRSSRLLEGGSYSEPTAETQ